MARAEIQHEAKKDPRVGSQLVDELLDHWWSRRFDPPLIALDGANQALELVESIADVWDSYEADRLRSRCRLIRGNALRQLGRHDEAMHELLEAEDLADRQTPEEARSRDVRLTLLLDLGRWDDALWLSSRVIASWRLLRDPSRVENARLQRARARRHTGDVSGALMDYSKLLRTATDPLIVLLASHNVADILTSLERWGGALEVIELAEEYYRDHGKPVILLRRQWLLGRIHAGLGDPDRGEQMLMKVYQQQIAEGRLVDAAECALDLCRIYRDQGRWPVLMRTARAAADQLERAGVSPDAVKAVQLVRDGARQASVTFELIRRAQGLIRKLP
jgi:tetratricopeptide (TPR) repeat protein